LGHELFHEAAQAHMRGDLAQAEFQYCELLAQKPEHAGALANLGLLLANRGETTEAIACYEKAIRIAPDVRTTHCNLGQALQATKRWEEAAASYSRALALDPQMELAALGLSTALMAMERKHEALEVFGRALAFPPQNRILRAALHGNRGTLHRELGLTDQAGEDYRTALQWAPHVAPLWNNLAELCFSIGRAKEGLAHNRKAREIAPNEPLFASNLLFQMHFLPGSDGAVLGRELAAWRTKFADPLRSEMRPWENDRTPERPLRVGLVSPNFRDHVVGRNVMPLFRHADRSQFALFCYSDVPYADRLTGEFRRLAAVFRDVADMNDAALAEQIRADRIDVLVDLNLHMVGHRLLVFVRKPAPVQVTFAGYPGTTGLDSIDYRLTDPHLDPPGVDEGRAHYAEKSVHLPATFWCYDPLDDDPPPVGPLPALTNGVVTFGCLNNFCKVNEEVLGLWAKVMARVPGSRIVLLAAEGWHREQPLQMLENLGVARGRVTFLTNRPRAEYLKAYQQIDIGLDTVPYNGHTTSLDSCFMGVPVVTLVGKTVVGRAGHSQLTNLGMRELIGRTEEEFVAIAVRLAGDLEGLAKIRAGLRQRMRQSPLMDGAAFARGIEGAWRQIWRAWCAKTNG
jgi:protein O-GlcNAc transferase